MSHELAKIRSALEEHLSAINENTAEIQALFDYIQELENKFERLSQRLDGVQLSEKVLKENKPISLSLSQMEKKVFLVLYTEESPLTSNEIAVKAEVSKYFVPECISSLTQKGLPLHRSFANDQLFWTLDQSFKERQAKENLVNLSLQSFMQ